MAVSGGGGTMQDTVVEQDHAAEEATPAEAADAPLEEEAALPAAAEMAVEAAEPEPEPEPEPAEVAVEVAEPEAAGGAETAEATEAAEADGLGVADGLLTGAMEVTSNEEVRGSVALLGCSAWLLCYTTLLHYPATLHCYTALLHYSATLHCYTALLHCSATLPCYTTLLHCSATLPYSAVRRSPPRPRKSPFATMVCLNVRVPPHTRTTICWSRPHSPLPSPGADHRRDCAGRGTRSSISATRRSQSSRSMKAKYSCGTPTSRATSGSPPRGCDPSRPRRPLLSGPVG